MSKVKTYFEETYIELVEKVSWPTWSELQSSALIVMVASVIIALVVFGYLVYVLIKPEKF